MDRRTLLTIASCSGLASCLPIRESLADENEIKNKPSKTTPDENRTTLTAVEGSSDDDLIHELQIALGLVDCEPTANRTCPSPDQMESLLAFAENELPEILNDIYDTSHIWLSPEDVAIGRDCRTLKVGEKNLPNQYRVHKHGTFDYRHETRSARAKAYIEFCHPSIDDIWRDVRSCAIIAAVSAVVAAILAENPGAAKAVFYPVFVNCLKRKIGNRAKEITVHLYMRTEHGCWSNHC